MKVKMEIPESNHSKGPITLSVIFDGMMKKRKKVKDKDTMCRKYTILRDFSEVIFETNSKEEMSMYLSLHGYSIRRLLFDKMGVCAEEYTGYFPDNVIARIHELERV